MATLNSLWRCLIFIDKFRAPKRGKGSHLAFVKHDSGKSRLVIVPDRDNIPRGTLLSILDQAGITKDEFVKLLSQ
ncbi:MAG: type II toxin-antitoxin system HicA family toxin [Thermodesulfobacteriota bacterium]